MAIIQTAMLLSKFVPSIVRFFKGDNAGNVAAHLIDKAKKITGLDDPDDIMQALEKNPEHVVALQKSMNEVIVAAYQAEASQIEQINLTMRAELSSSHFFKSGWRPFFGWVVGVTWAIQTLSFVIISVYAIVKNPTTAHQTITAMATLAGAMMVMWSLALGVLGININKRSQDKQVAAGQNPTIGIIGALASKFIKR